MLQIYAAYVNDLPDPKDVPLVMEGLPKMRKQKIVNCKQVDKRKQCLGAGLMLKRVLTDFDKEIENITYGEMGKPQIEGLSFNLSHSQDVVVCAVSDKRVGCDVEKIGCFQTKIAERFFTNGELCNINLLEGEDKNKELYRLWTIKESYGKMTGEGIVQSLKHMEVVLGNQVVIYRDGAKCDCTIIEAELEGYQMTVCTEGVIPKETLQSIVIKKINLL